MDKLQLVCQMVLAKQNEITQTSQNPQAEFMTYICQLILMEPRDITELLLTYADQTIQLVEQSKATLEADKLQHTQTLTQKTSDLRTAKETL